MNHRVVKNLDLSVRKPEEYGQAIAQKKRVWSVLVCAQDVNMADEVETGACRTPGTGIAADYAAQKRNERVEPRVERLPLSGKGTQTALELVHDPMLIGMKEARLEAVSERAVRPMKETLGP